MFIKYYINVVGNEKVFIISTCKEYSHLLSVSWEFYIIIFTGKEIIFVRCISHNNIKFSLTMS